MNRTIAVADVGGTHARFALADVSGGRVVSLGEPVVLRTLEHAGLTDAWEAFGRTARTRLPDALALAFAGPVGGQALKLTNSGWVVRPELAADQLGVSQCMFVNDFGAIAHAVAQLGPDHFDHLRGPEKPTPDRGVTTVVGPGTGLGVAQLIHSAGAYSVVETEGGHIDFAPLDAIEDEILAYLRERFQRVSVERIVSGPGLANLYAAIASIEGIAASQLDDEMIWANALDGSDPLAVTAIDRFMLSLGSITGDLALAHGSNAVVIAGNLGNRLKDRLATSGFSGRFVAKGRFREMMEAVPVKVLNHPQPGLYGAAAAFAKEHA